MIALALVLSLNAHVAMEPFSLVVQTHAVEISGMVCISVEGPEYYARSCWDQQGASPVNRRVFRSIPFGTYSIIGWVDGQIETTQNLRVVCTEMGNQSSGPRCPVEEDQ